SMHGCFQAILGLVGLALSLLCSTLNVGIYFALPTLRGFSLATLNSVLFVPHLSTLPDYTFVFLGQTTSLVQRDFLLAFLPIMALYTLIDAYLKAGVLVRTSGLGNRWYKTIYLFGRNFLANLLYVLVLSWLLASGVFLLVATDRLFSIPVRYLRHQA